MRPETRNRSSRGRLVIHCLSGEAIWIGQSKLVITDKLIDQADGRLIYRFGAWVRIKRDGYVGGQRNVRVIVEAPREVVVIRDRLRIAKMAEAMLVGRGNGDGRAA